MSVRTQLVSSLVFQWHSWPIRAKQKEEKKEGEMNSFMQFILTSVEDNALRFGKFMQSVLNYMLLVIVGHTQNKCLVLHKTAIFRAMQCEGEKKRKRKKE